LDRYLFEIIFDVSELLGLLGELSIHRREVDRRGRDLAIERTAIKIV
jgi:hypothetical protein